MEQRDQLAELFADPRDRGRVDKLFWLTNHRRAPEVWAPDRVRDLMTRNYTGCLVWDSMSLKTSPAGRRRGLLSKGSSDANAAPVGSPHQRRPCMVDE